MQTLLTLLRLLARHLPRQAFNERDKARMHDLVVRNQFAIDPIIAKKHDGPTVASNLTLSCILCNSFKGPNLAGVDPKETARGRGSRGHRA